MHKKRKTPTAASKSKPLLTKAQRSRLARMLQQLRALIDDDAARRAAIAAASLN